MVERMVKASVTGWRPWAIGAALSMGCAALMVFRWQRAAVRTLDSYEQWWQHRDRVRSNGDHARASGDARFV